MQQAAEQPTSTHHDFIVEVLQQSRIVSTTQHKAQLRKYIYQYRAEFDKFNAKNREIKDVSLTINHLKISPSSSEQEHPEPRI